MEKSREKVFADGITLVALAIFVSMFSFITEDSSITGFAVSESSNAAVGSGLPIYENVKSLATLAAGNYYVDSNGIVYWADDEPMPAVGQISIAEDSQKNRHIYIDGNGNIGYVLESVSINNEENEQ